MATYNEPIRNFECVLHAHDSTVCFDAVTITKSKLLQAGTVLQKDGSTGKFVELVPGTGSAVAVLCQTVDATAADAQATAVVRCASVKKDALQFLAGATQPNKDKAIGELEAATIAVI